MNSSLLVSRRVTRLAGMALLVGILLCALPGALSAHTVTTADGTVYEGKIVLSNAEKVVISTTFEGQVTVPRSDVKAIDDRTPPLRDQLAFRAERAQDDVPRLWDLHKWAGEKGFEPELVQILERIIQLSPKNGKAHRLLGHEKVDGTWMTQEEKVVYLREQEAAEMQAKGLVLHEDRWVTPEEKNALENGLIKDGDDYVTEEEYHRRRGEKLVNGEWVRVGEKEAKVWGEGLKSGRVKAKYLWSPSVDVWFDVKQEHAERVAESAEKVMRAFHATLHPSAQAYPDGVGGRINLHLFLKLPAYARFAQYFDKKERCSDLVKGWVGSVRRQHSFWWVDPVGVVGVYKFPNTPRTFISNAVHDMGLILITRYRFNYRFPAYWLQEGFAYFLEMEANGYSETFSLSRGGTGAASGARPVWVDSDKWRTGLKQLVSEGQDPPMKRLSRMRHGQMHYIELVKSWSIIECLVRLDREKFVTFIDTLKDREKTDEDALKEVYGWSWRNLDKTWRGYVMRGFTHHVPAPAEENGKE